MRGAELRALVASVMLERYQFMRQAGLSFDGERDMYRVLGYDRMVTIRQYREEYARGGIATRIVDALPDATWRGDLELIEDENPEKLTPFEESWETLDNRLNVKSMLNRVDKLSQLSTFAVLLIGAEGNLEEELPKATKGQESLLYFAPFLGGGHPLNQRNQAPNAEMFDADAKIHEWETDPANPRFGLPKFYTLKRTNIHDPNFMRPVHHSRVLHVADGCLEDEVFGKPALEKVWNLLKDLEKVTGGGAEAFWLRANQGLHLDIAKDMALDATKDTVASLKEQAELYAHQQTRWLRTRGVTVATLGSDVANFGPPAESILTQISGASKIPKRILTGSEMGELASSQDRENWKDQVVGRQTGYAAPFIVRRLVDRLVKYGYLEAPKKADTYEVRFSSIVTMTEQEKVEGAKGWAAVNATYRAPVFTDAEIREKWADKAPLTPEQRQEMKENAETYAVVPPQPEAPALSPEDEEVAEVLRAAMEAGAEDVIDLIVRGGAQS